MNIPQNSHSQYLIETYKAWNKMHDPLSDSAITNYNYNIDEVPTAQVTLEEFLEEIRKNPFISLKTKNWQFLVKCKKKLGFYQKKMSVKA